ncbi:hypothetical protein E2C01_021704 [Portunus trituberculatus]|uniref:Uncharacterized protein n=1 Tax=Portunus trituberculatus TaxID=210409 RepID=A0A5B7E434_PORTR|nr:hypothetical protein [Portunus trituberculatus]
MCFPILSGCNCIFFISSLKFHDTTTHLLFPDQHQVSHPSYLPSLFPSLAPSAAATRSMGGAPLDFKSPDYMPTETVPLINHSV